MALIFIDSYDHYDNLNTKWDQGAVGAGINSSGLFSRTGPGCCTIDQAFGPTKVFSARTELIVGSAFFCPGLDSFDIFQARAQAQSDNQVNIGMQGDGSILVTCFNSPFRVTLGQSSPGVMQPDVYNYVEARMVFSDSAAGIVIVKVNGQTVFSISGVNTAFPGVAFATGVRLMGPGGAGGARHDDTYICDALGGKNDTFLGAVRIYAEVPDADAAPLQWIPSTGLTHFNLVNEIPPDDDGSYVSSDTVANQDQYTYPTTPLTPPVTIVAVQHVLDAKLDVAGSRSIASSLDGVSSGLDFALTSDYVMYTTPYDDKGGVDWTLANFLTTKFGPIVTA